MRFARVADWLDWQLQLHPRVIEPGLERVRAVAGALDLLAPGATVITVAGTNGKGSSVAFLESLARASGYQPGSYTSPHMLAYNERIRLSGQDVDDALLVRAFDAVDRARGDTTLTFFEFGTLAALWCFREVGADPWILEVGLGGRLDAVNVLDADVAVITSIALDHADWLGDDLDGIAHEKAGILRAGRPAICVDPQPPGGLATAAAAAGAQMLWRGRDFDAETTGDTWQWWGGERELADLPLPGWAGGDITNAAGALAAWQAAEPRLSFPAPENLARGLRGAQLRGRMEWLADDWLLDVAHNPAAAQRLARALRHGAPGRPVRAAMGAMARKDAAGVVAALASVVDVWHPLALPDEDAWSADEMSKVIAGAGGQLGESGAAEVLFPMLAERDGVKLVCGSFRAVELAMRWYGERGDKVPTGQEGSTCSKA
jgi:dihydrofolate synthase/folylpolyglutamate synthase